MRRSLCFLDLVVSQVTRGLSGYLSGTGYAVVLLKGALQRCETGYADGR